MENALRRQGEAFKDLTPEELETLVNDLVDEYTAANLPGMTLRMEYLVGRIRRNLVGLLGFIQRDLRQSGFQPVAFELRIDDRPDADDPDAPRVDPVELDDGAGHIVRIVGTVDRVDAMPLEKLGRTYLRVVDYKTGGKEFKLKEVYCGLDCQMLLYLFTLERNAKRQFQVRRRQASNTCWPTPRPRAWTAASWATMPTRPDLPDERPAAGRGEHLPRHGHEGHRRVCAAVLQRQDRQAAERQKHAGRHGQAGPHPRPSGRTSHRYGEESVQRPH
ncbi:PD-(D/E)XK nuclease family protein [Gemmiger formicilis]|nr:PD-(D/E)XK nuclease family protein [Gemmiger formicilis]